MSAKIMTLTRHIIDEQHKYPEATGEFTNLMNDLCFAAKRISYHTNKAGLLNVLGETDIVNVQGERVQKLDVFAHETMVKSLDHGGNLCCMASEEEEDIIPIPKEYPIGKYVCLFDPLDGSSNIDANVSVGTIFSIYRRITEDDIPGKLEDCLQPGHQQVCAGYVIYGSSTMLVYTTGYGVHGFTLDPSFGEFVLSHPNIQIPEKANIYSVNESNFDDWDETVKNYIRYVKGTDESTNRPLNSRYIGSMVSDVHRNLLYGGIFLYPASSKAPNGKLRLIYEANPMAYIVEQAGGRYIGCSYDVKMIEDYLRGIQ
jgi:fructose-1,6-bisphosphatase I